MHIHDLYAGRSPYRNMPAPRNINPVRTFTTVEDLLHGINSRIKRGNVTEYNAFSMLLAFVNENCPRKKNLDQGRPILVFDKNLWKAYVNNMVNPNGTWADPANALIARSIVNVGEQFFYLGFETGMWRAPDEERKIQAKKAALDLASMAGISPDEMKMRFPSLVNWINDGDNEDVSAPADDYGKISFVPLYNQHTPLFIDQRLGFNNLQHNPEVIREYVKYLRPITGRETKNKILVENQDRATVEALIKGKLVDVISLEEKDTDRLVITYTCPVRNESREPLMAVPVFPIESARNKSKDEEEKAEAAPAPESVIVF